jgi:hypothetical protein
MNTATANTPHSLYELYETLPNEVQQAFLQELIQKKVRCWQTCVFFWTVKKQRMKTNF